MKFAPKLLGLAVVTLYILQGEVSFAAEMEIVVYAGRPVEHSLRSISEQLGVLITCEDPRLEYAQEMRNPNPDRLTHFVPRSSRFSFSYDSDGDVEETIEALLAAHDSTGNPGRFSVSRSGSVFNVYPTHSRNADGELVRHRSGLDSKISVSLPDTNLLEAFTSICEMASGDTPREKIHFISQSVRGLDSKPYSLELNDITVREALSMVLEECNRTVLRKSSYQATWIVRDSPRGQAGYVVQTILFRTNPADTVKIVVEAGRPMAQALVLLKERFGIQSGYEDPRRQCPCEVYSGNVPTGGFLGAGWNHMDDPSIVVDKLLKSYNRQKFTFTERNGRFHVYPAAVRDAEGELKPVAALTGAEISIDGRGNSVNEAVSQFTTALGAVSGARPVRRVTGATGQPDLAATMIDPVARSGKAAEVLDDLLAQHSDKLSWRLLHDPATDEYQLYIE